MPIRQPEAWVGGEMLPVYIISTEIPKKISGFKKLPHLLLLRTAPDRVLYAGRNFVRKKRRQQ